MQKNIKDIICIKSFVLCATSFRWWCLFSGEFVAIYGKFINKKGKRINNKRNQIYIVEICRSTSGANDDGNGARMHASWKISQRCSLRLALRKCWKLVHFNAHKRFHTQTASLFIYNTICNCWMRLWCALLFMLRFMPLNTCNPKITRLKCNFLAQFYTSSHRRWKPNKLDNRKPSPLKCSLLRFKCVQVMQQSSDFLPTASPTVSFRDKILIYTRVWIHTINFVFIKWIVKRFP